MKKEVVVLVGAGSIGLAIARRVSEGNHLVLADYSIDYGLSGARSGGNHIVVSAK